MKTNEILEVVRYFVSILLIVVVLNTKPDMNLISESIIRICKVTLYNAIIVFAMIQLGRVHNYMSSFISTNVYIYSDEVRLNGFFSDPNKYMTFCLALLFYNRCICRESNIQKKRNFNSEYSNCVINV